MSRLSVILVIILDLDKLIFNEYSLFGFGQTFKRVFGLLLVWSERNSSNP